MVNSSELVLEYLQQGFEEDNQNYLNTSERSTGFKTLDSYLKGFPPAIYGIAGGSSVGKTAFVLQLGYNLAKAGEPVILVNYEMSKRALVCRMMAHQIHKLFPNLKISSADIPSFKSKQPDIYKQAITDFTQHPFNFTIKNHVEDLTISKLIEIVNQQVTKTSKPVVLVDYLQIIPREHSEIKQMLDEDLPQLKRFQHQTQTTFVLMSSVNDVSYRQDMGLESFKESGIIEFNADVLFGLQYSFLNYKTGTKYATTKEFQNAMEEYPRFLTLKCLKNRNGSCFSLDLEFYPDNGTFMEMGS